MNTPRKVCVVTGSRAEYGLLFWLMREIQNDPDLVLQVVVTGMHLSDEHGSTYQIIKRDGFKIDAKVDLKLADNRPTGIAKSVGIGIGGLANIFTRLRPDIIVLLGDRYEIFSAAQAAMLTCIPIAHIHGGEATEGLIDEAIRHSITKMAHFHFVTAIPYRNRVIQLGEDPSRVFAFGAPGLDYIDKLTFLSKARLEKELVFKLGHPLLLITYHPVTLDSHDPSTGVTALLEAVDEFRDACLVFTKANADASGRVVNQLIDRYVQKNSIRARSFVNLGQERYLSVMKYADVVVGNSSSGIIEAPIVKVPTVNIGNRQRGRLKAESVVDCAEEKGEIVQAIKKTLSLRFKSSLKNMRSPYLSGNVSKRIKDVLKKVNLSEILMKKFYDLPVK